MKKIKIGLLGFGTVGSAVYDLLKKNQDVIRSKTPQDLEIKKICVRDLKKDRHISKNLFTNSYGEIVNNSEIDVVVEVMGDCPEALEAIRCALKNGKAVVTANKSVIAKHGPELFLLAKENKTQILFEASVGGGIPILRFLREGISANRISTLRGIVNGTCNFVLTEMGERKSSFEEALKQAKNLGYAEANPKSDIDGQDSAYKLCILIMLTYGKWVPVENIPCEGIAFLQPIDFEMANRFHYRLKLMGITRLRENKIEARVHPVMISKENPIAHVNGSLNAIQYIGDFVGEGMLTGPGAGGPPTASAIVSDLIEISQNFGASFLSPTGFPLDGLERTLPCDQNALECPYYLRMTVVDQPKVLSQITTILGENNISIQNIYQHAGQQENLPVSIIVFTHLAKEKNLQRAMSEINLLKAVKAKTQIVRIEEEKNV